MWQCLPIDSSEDLEGGMVGFFFMSFLYSSVFVFYSSLLHSSLFYAIVKSLGERMLIHILLVGCSLDVTFGTRMMWISVIIAGGRKPRKGVRGLER